MTFDLHGHCTLHKVFRKILGEAWFSDRDSLVLSEHLHLRFSQERDRRDSEIDADLTAASTLALRMVMTIAKIYGLRPGDLQDWKGYTVFSDMIELYQW